MTKEKYILHEDSEDFFRLNGNAVMAFSRTAAKQIFEIAGSRGFAIMRYEGGILENGAFEARLDAIWDRYYLHSGLNFLEEGNRRAMIAIESEPENYNAFIVTVRAVK